ncbi:hypothetical protein ACFQ2Y_17225 [Streptomyces malaysiensis subsp. malaysiensis]
MPSPPEPVADPRRVHRAGRAAGPSGPAGPVRLRRGRPREVPHHGAVVPRSGRAGRRPRSRAAPPPRQLPQLLRVVEHFAALCGGAVAGELRAWSLECARRIDLEGQLYERRGEAQEHAERVKADPDTATDQGHLPAIAGEDPDKAPRTGRGRAAAHL